MLIIMACLSLAHTLSWLLTLHYGACHVVCRRCQACNVSSDVAVVQRFLLPVTVLDHLSAISLPLLYDHGKKILGFDEKHMLEVKLEDEAEYERILKVGDALSCSSHFDWHTACKMVQCCC